MLRRFPIRVPGVLWAGVTLLLAGACGKDNLVRPVVVSSVTATVDPAAYLGPCPGTFNLSADITARPGTVTYRWERSDGAVGATQTLNFSGTGTQTVKDSWQPDAVGSFWARVHVLTPAELYSNQAAFTNGCGALAVSATAGVSPSNYTSDCPGTFDLSGAITANGASTVTYRWERNDGVASPTKTLTFTGAGSQTVTHSWQIDATGSFWVWIHVLTPIDRTSGVAYFTNRCGSATAATAGVSPASYSGDCPGAFDCSADITAGAGTVTYRWERSDGSTGTTGTLSFGSAGTQAVTDTWQLGVVGQHWARVHVLTPSELYSNQATFTNDCGASGPFGVTAVTARVSPSYYYGGCPAALDFSADISANGSGGVGTVTYRWEASDGSIGPTETLDFTGPGTQTVTGYSVSYYPDGSFWQRVHILTPNDLLSNPAAFSVECCFGCDP